MKPKFYTALLVVAVAAVIGFWFKIGKNTPEPSSPPQETTTSSSNPTVSITVNPKPSTSLNPNKVFRPSVSNLPVLTLGEVHDLIQKNDGKFYYYLTEPAICKVSGKIIFLDHNIAKIDKANFVYTGIESETTQIKWIVDPNDNLQVGPNLAAGLYLPDGERVVGVNLPISPKSKNYILTAAITYRRLVNGNIKPYEARCTGRVDVQLSY